MTTLGSIHDIARDTRWTGAELAAEAHRRALALATIVAVEQPMVVIAHGGSLSFFADLLAVWSVGGCAACVNQGLTPGELTRVVAFVNADVVLVDDDAPADLGVPVIRLQDEPPGDGQITGNTLDAPALILFTSGTTGDPKGVVHTHRSLLSRISLNAAYIGRDTLANTLCTLPTHFGHGLIGNCLTPLYAGGDVYLAPSGGIQTASTLGSLVDNHKISFMSSVPALWKVAKRMAKPPSSRGLRRVHIGSAPLSADLWQEVVDWSGDAEVVNMYGITETANWIGGASSAHFTPEDGLLGTLWGGEVAVLGESGERQARGEGEIIVRTPSLMSGYHGRDDLTASVLVNGWYHTGDTGAIDAQGVLRLTGRNRYMINNAGIKVYPEELDLLYERHADVREACAFGVDDAISGQSVALAVVVEEGASVTAKDLMSWARSRIRPEAVPRQVFMVSDIPKTDRGKINRDNVAAFCAEVAV